MNHCETCKHWERNKHNRYEHVTHDNSFYVRSDEYELVKEEAA